MIRLPLDGDIDGDALKKIKKLSKDDHHFLHYQLHHSPSSFNPRRTGSIIRKLLLLVLFLIVCVVFISVRSSKRQQHRDTVMVVEADAGAHQQPHQPPAKAPPTAERKRLRPLADPYIASNTLESIVARAIHSSIVVIVPLRSRTILQFKHLICSLQQHHPSLLRHLVILPLDDDATQTAAFLHTTLLNETYVVPAQHGTTVKQIPLLKKLIARVEKIVVMDGEMLPKGLEWIAEEGHRRSASTPVADLVVVTGMTLTDVAWGTLGLHGEKMASFLDAIERLRLDEEISYLKAINEVLENPEEHMGEGWRFVGSEEPAKDGAEDKMVRVKVLDRDEWFEDASIGGSYLDETGLVCAVRSDISGEGQSWWDEGRSPRMKENIWRFGSDDDEDAEEEVNAEDESNPEGEKNPEVEAPKGKFVEADVDAEEVENHAEHKRKTHVDDDIDASDSQSDKLGKFSAADDFEDEAMGRKISNGGDSDSTGRKSDNDNDAAADALSDRSKSNGDDVTTDRRKDSSGVDDVTEKKMSDSGDENPGDNITERDKDFVPDGKALKSKEQELMEQHSFALDGAQKETEQLLAEALE
ncbi:hypothetical protein HK101_008119 [Irineochytrium annulatum]|nr:hypothetical protein HK101_008119 [Irineochytrium annulatum]